MREESALGVCECLHPVLGAPSEGVLVGVPFETSGSRVTGKGKRDSCRDAVNNFGRVELRSDI